MTGAPDSTSLGTTQSLCPVCLARITAERLAEGDDVYLEKRCPDHGMFKTIIWRGPPSFQSWAVPGRTSPLIGAGDGCPFECGLCAHHRQQTCCVLLEVTQRCNLQCPVCFAAAGEGLRDPDLRHVDEWYRKLLDAGGPFNIQLSGGEPTVRDDLPEIIALGRSLGFQFFQLNTNGVRLARDPAYVRRLKDAGLGCVFLQFDGTSDAIHRRLRGAALAETKAAAIARCAEQRLGVMLVPTVVRGVNTGELGAIVAYALERTPVVRGVHFQPVSFFGRYPSPPADLDRVTIPEVLQLLEQQTGGAIRASHFRPPSAENAYCSFNGTFILSRDGSLKPAGGARPQGCCPAPTPPDDGAGAARSCCEPRRPGEDSRRARELVAARWVYPAASPSAPGQHRSSGTASLDAFLEEASAASFSISGMAFQDAWNIDLERLRDCFLHVVGPNTGIVPFCAYNLTDVSGTSLYRRHV
jgi:uncharacterized radical SAM superfamily Fe-S cluster-containing enzyme